MQQIAGTFILCVTNSEASEKVCNAKDGVNLTVSPEKWMWVGICMLIFVPLVWVRKTEKFAFTHIFADIMVLVGLVMVCVYGGKEVQLNGWKELDFVTSEFAFSISYAVFAFEGVGVVLPIMEITENKE